jgi:threonine dehydrogenase-like Zn-dependent dehydrogenase
MCSTVVEATGRPSVAKKAFNIVSPLGELILLGSPRGTYNNDITKLLNKIHLIEQGCITVKGAHEWRYPIKSESNHIKHSLERNIKILLRLIRTNKLRINELITHVLPPSKCVEAYMGLKNNKDEFLGVVFGWKTY